MAARHSKERETNRSSKRLSGSERINAFVSRRLSRPDTRIIFVLPATPSRSIARFFRGRLWCRAREELPALRRDLRSRTKNANRVIAKHCGSSAGAGNAKAERDLTEEFVKLQVPVQVPNDSPRTFQTRKLASLVLRRRVLRKTPNSSCTVCVFSFLLSAKVCCKFGEHGWNNETPPLAQHHPGYPCHRHNPGMLRPGPQGKTISPIQPLHTRKSRQALGI